MNSLFPDSSGSQPTRYRKWIGLWWQKKFMKTAFFILLPITILAIAFVLRMIWLNVKLSEKPKPSYPLIVDVKLSLDY